jgi:hypothetical protein
MLRAVQERIDAPLSIIPPGLLTEPVVGVIVNSPAMRRLVKLRAYLESRPRSGD